jgi:hypothetical protein
MGMDIDEAGRHNFPPGIDGLPGLCRLQPPNLLNPIPLQPQISLEAGAFGPVDNKAIFNDNIKHYLYAPD